MVDNPKGSRQASTGGKEDEMIGKVWLFVLLAVLGALFVSGCQTSKMTRAKMAKLGGGEEMEAVVPDCKH